MKKSIVHIYLMKLPSFTIATDNKQCIVVIFAIGANVS